MNVLRVRTGCRLHFGLMELANNEPSRFSGLGLMLSEPGFDIAFSTQAMSLPHASSIAHTHSESQKPIVMTEVTETAGDDERAVELQSRVAAVVHQRQTLDELSSGNSTVPCQVRIAAGLPLHSGLGAGTQLAAGVATGLELWARTAAVSQLQQIEDATWRKVQSVHPQLTPQWLSGRAARGLRSAVGLVGFLQGGLILDGGYATPEEPTAIAHNTATRPLVAETIQVAEAWRVVLIVPQTRAELSGSKEAAVMEELATRPNPHRERMVALARRTMTLAGDGQRFDDFTDCLDRYMELGSRLFSRHQGGMYNGADVTEAVKMARGVGLRGVGQSSWGPTVFGFAENELSASSYAEQLARNRPDWSVRISTPARHGAEYRWQSFVGT